jgi:hypothetical protein
MILLQLKNRIIEDKDWTFIVFVLVLLLIVFIKSSFEKRFYDFTRIIISDKYLRTYKDSSNLLTPFTILVFIVNVFSFAFFIQLLGHSYGICDKTDWVFFIRSLSFLMVFILIKFLLEKIVATIFKIEDVVDEYNLSKVNFRTYMGLVLLPISIIMFYNAAILEVLVVPVAYILLILNTLTYGITMVRYQNNIIDKLFYFILYLCTFEIAPYYFIYYLIIKN